MSDRSSSRGRVGFLRGKLRLVEVLTAIDDETPLDEVAREILIREAMEMADGNQEQAGRLLNMSGRMVAFWRAKYGIDK